MSRPARSEAGSTGVVAGRAVPPALVGLALIAACVSFGRFPSSEDVERAARAAAESEAELHAARARLGSFEYTLRMQGSEVGTYRLELEWREENEYRLREEVEGGLLDQRTEHRFRTDLTPLSLEQEGPVGARLEFGVRRVRGTVTGVPGEEGGLGERTIDGDLEEGTLYGGAAVAAVLAGRLEDGFRMERPAFEPAAGTGRLEIMVEGEETVRAPAGTFPVFRVAASGIGEEFTMFVTRETPRLLVRQEWRDEAVSIELKAPRR